MNDTQTDTREAALRKAIAQIRKSLEGIDRQETDDNAGWWETSVGADFGSGRLKEVLSIVSALTMPDTQTDTRQPTGYTIKPIDDLVLVTRFEVIADGGRAITKYDQHVELSLQDEGRTLKVFLTDR